MALGFALAGTTNAVPLSNPTPTLHPLFTVVSRIPVSTASGVANATAGKFPSHKHTPDCEHNYNGKSNRTTDDGAHKSTTTEGKGHVTGGEYHDSESKGNPSLYPDLDATSLPPPPSGQAPQAHKHSGYNRDHPSHNNMTATDAAYLQPAYPVKINASADPSHTHTGDRCAHPSHHNGTNTTSDSHVKRSVVSEVDVTVCLGADCKARDLVTAMVDDSGKLVGIKGKNSNGVLSREDKGMSYADLARQMSGARIVGGV